MNQFGSPFMAKSPLNQKTREQKLREKIKETEKKAYMKGSPDYTDEEYEESPEEKRAQKKLKRLNKIPEKEGFIDPKFSNNVKDKDPNDVIKILKNNTYTLF